MHQSALRGAHSIRVQSILQEEEEEEEENTEPVQPSTIEREEARKKKEIEHFSLL